MYVFMSMGTAIFLLFVCKIVCDRERMREGERERGGRERGREEGG